MTARTRTIPAYLLIGMGLTCLAWTGCGSGLVDVQGKVTLDGKPLETGNVVFLSGDRAPAVGKLQAGGYYEMKTGPNVGIAPGTYDVTVSAFRTTAADDQGEPIPVFLTPEKYNRAETSGLTAEVTGGDSEFNFDLSSR